MTFLLVSILLFAFNNVLWKQLLNSYPPLILILTRALFTSVLGALVLVFLRTDLLSNFLNFGMAGLFASVLGGCGLLFMLFGLKKGSLKVFGVYSLFGTLISCTYLYWFENFSIENYFLGSVSISIGFLLFLFSRNKGEEKPGLKTHLNYLFMILFFSASSIVHWKNLSTGASPLFTVALQEMIVFALGVFAAVLLGQKLRITEYLNFKFIGSCTIMAFVVFGALVFGFLGLKITDPYLNSLLSLTVPVLTILFGVLFFKEKLNSTLLVSLSCISLGAFLIKV